MSEIKPEYDYLCLVFENCDCIDIEAKHILSFVIREITDNVWSNCIWQYNKYKSSTYAAVLCKNSALELKTQLDMTLKDRLKLSNDITHIEIVNGEDKLYVATPWEDIDNKLTNSLQETEYYEDRFSICISEDNFCILNFLKSKFFTLINKLRRNNL